MANEAMMAQTLRGSDYQVPQGGYFGDMPQYSLGNFGKARAPGQGVIPQEQLAQAMAPPQREQQAPPPTQPPPGMPPFQAPPQAQQPPQQPPQLPPGFKMPPPGQPNHPGPLAGLQERRAIQQENQRRAEAMRKEMGMSNNPEMDAIMQSPAYEQYTAQQAPQAAPMAPAPPGMTPPPPGNMPTAPAMAETVQQLRQGNYTGKRAGPPRGRGRR